jgi:hypothetical protein
MKQSEVWKRFADHGGYQRQFVLICSVWGSVFLWLEFCVDVVGGIGEGRTYFYKIIQNPPVLECQGLGSGLESEIKGSGVFVVNSTSLFHEKSRFEFHQGNQLLTICKLLRFWPFLEVFLLALLKCCVLLEASSVALPTLYNVRFILQKLKVLVMVYDMELFLCWKECLFEVVCSRENSSC